MPVDVNEVAVQRKLTREFIRRGNRKELVLNFEQKVADLSGGMKRGVPDTRSKQVFHLAVPTTQLPERVTAAGITAVPEYILVGYHDAVVQRGDWFYMDGIKYEVVFVHPDRSYETRAEVVYLG